MRYFLRMHAYCMVINTVFYAMYGRPLHGNMRMHCTEVELGTARVRGAVVPVRPRL